MADIIFHHYPTSPFSEKIRLILGYKKLPWKSVIIPAIMPKPLLMPLTGGYRRTPVMQIGADVYCDSALIADVLERIAPTPTLYPKESEGLARTLAQWADSTLFWTVIPYVFQPASVQEILAGFNGEQLKAFSADRTAFRGSAPRLSPQEAAAALPEYLRRLNAMLADGRPFLLGSAPCIADFSAYHCIWFLQRAKSLAGILGKTPDLLAWCGRVAAIGHHEFEKMSGDQALAVALASDPAVASQEAEYIEQHGVALGDKVTVMPSDYGLDPVEGELVLATSNEFAVRRATEDTGTVVVHFPRIGFQLKKA